MIETGLGKKIVVVLIIVAVVVAAYYLLSNWPLMRDRDAPQGIQSVSEETRSVTLFFADREGDRLLAETHEIPEREGFEVLVESVVAELIRGPHDDKLVSVIPPQSDVLQVFWDDEEQTLFLDMNRAFVTNHQGGSTAEYYTISMIIGTINANFPQVRKLQFLVDGYPVETIAGHYAVDKPIDVLKWR